MIANIKILQLAILQYFNHYYFIADLSHEEGLIRTVSYLLIYKFMRKMMKNRGIVLNHSTHFSCFRI